MKKILFLIIVFVICGCSDYSVTFHSGEGIEGIWRTEFTATYFNQAGIHETDRETHNIVHTSTMTLKDGQFDINIHPAVPPFGEYGKPQSHWVGEYYFEDGNLVMIERNVIDMEDIYRFKLSGDSLQLVLNYKNHPDNDSIMAVPLYGGLPWGRAQLWNSGYFCRILNEE